MRDISGYLQDLDINLHGQARLFQGEVCLIGVGGSNITPFSTPSEFSEEELHETGSRAFRQAAEFTSLAEPLNKKKIPVLFVSHVPPRKTSVDTLRSGKHVGSTAIRKIIEHYRPNLCICGHIHEAKGEDAIDGIPVYNTGMLREGGWITITLEQSRLKAELS